MDASEIFHMRELSADDINAGEEKLDKATGHIYSVEHEERGLFDWYRIHSSDHEYEVTRLGLFVRCTCKDFQFSGTACKHIPLCLPKLCRGCFETEVNRRGEKCSRCMEREAVYLTPHREKPAELVGGIRI